MPKHPATFNLRGLVLVLCETLILGIAFFGVLNFTAFINRWVREDGPPLSWWNLILRSLLVTALVQISHLLQDLYEWRVISNRALANLRLVQSMFVAAILVGLSHYLLYLLSDVWSSPILGGYVSNPWTTLVALIAAFPISYYYRSFFSALLRKSGLNERLLFLGNGEIAGLLEQELSLLQDPGYEIVGYVGQEPERPVALSAPHLGEVDAVQEVAIKHDVSLVVVAMSERRRRLPLIELLNCRLAGIKVEEAELLYERLTGKIPVQRLRPSYLIFSEGFQCSKMQFAIKRTMDVTLALVGLLITLPLCVIVAGLIKLDSKGPMLFRQRRVGKDGRIFTVFKFRSMRPDAESRGPQWAAEDDDRITRVGRVIRLTRIDEIPQMWNVMRNEMSFVGPRPERPFFVDELRKQIPYYMERLLAKPGITGWAQINYRYGSSVEDALTKLQYDLYYIKHLSIFLDLLILVGTVKVILLRRGAV